MVNRGVHEKDFATSSTSFLTKGSVLTQELDEHKPTVFNPDEAQGVILDQSIQNVDLLSQINSYLRINDFMTIGNFIKAFKH